MAEKDYKDWRYAEPAIKSFAYKVARRLLAVGAPTMTLEDVTQELWVAWCIAVESYDPESNVPFLAFLRSGMKMHMNRYIEKNVNRRIAEVWATSFDASVGDDEEDGATLHESIPSADPSPFDKIAEDQAIERISKRLSKDARVFLNILYKQPPEILAEVRALSARYEYARERGLKPYFSNRLTSAVIFDAMGISSARRTKIIREIEKAVERL